MRIWVDGDATPRPVKDILFRAAVRTEIELVLVANQPMHTPKTRLVRSVVVPGGFDVADEHIIAQVEPGDLVITQDVPLAAAAVERGATCIDVRGKVIDADNARARLARRDRNEEDRLAGLFVGGPSPFSNRDKRAFAGALDRWLAKALRQRG